MNLTASIVVYRNNPDILAEAIRSCLKSCPGIHLYVVDNSPTDNARALCRSPGITYIFNNRNIGFGPGHNVALKRVLDQSTYHIVVNPDVYFDEAVIPRMWEFMQKHPDVGLAMPKVLYPDGRLQHLCKLLPKPQNLIYRRFLKVCRTFERFNHVYEMQFTGYDTVMDVPFLSGCFMFVRNEALAKAGLFDETMFLYSEDIDLSRRINKYFRTVFYPEVSIYHHHEKGSHKELTLLLHHIGSTIRYFDKWGWFDDQERDEVNGRILSRYAIDEAF